MTVRAELQLAGSWVDITSDLYTRDPITITRGKANEGSQAAPSGCNLTLNNRNGKYSPRNPLSPYYGQIGRNTPIRVGELLPAGGNALVFDEPLTSDEDASTPDSVATSITGDIDVRADLSVWQADGWQGSFNVICKQIFVAGFLSWCLAVENGTLLFRWETAAGVMTEVNSTVPLPSPYYGRKAIRATLDVNNGAGGNTVTFYTASNMGGTWVQLGSPVVTAGTTNIRDTTTPTRVGDSGGYLPLYSPYGVVYKAEVRNGIGGTVVANPDFTAQAAGTTSFVDSSGNTWTLNDGATIAPALELSPRFSGEVSSFPPRWDTSGNDAWVPIECAGLLRRLNQGSKPATTGLRDYTLSQQSALKTYYPLSGGEGTTYSLNLAPGRPGYRFYGQSVPGQVPVFTYGKDMGASWLGTGMELNATGNAYMRGDVGSGDPNVAFDFVFQSPSLGVLTVQLQDYNENLWSLVLDTSTNDGTLQVSFDDPNVGPIGFLTVGPFSELQDANLHHCRFQLTTNGADTGFAVYLDGTLVSSGTMSGYTVNGMSLFRLFYTRYTGQTVMNIAHLTVWGASVAANIPAIADVVSAAFGYAGETAGARMVRVAELAGIPLVVVGNTVETTAMGQQFSEETLAQIRDAEGTDLGILTETRDALSLMYRTRASIYNQDPVLTIDYSAGQLSPPFEPVDDDQQTRNEVTATRREGDSFKVTLASGPLSVLDPPNGVGRYDDQITVNVETDAMLPSVASWLLNIGTLDQPRYPSVAVNLAAPDVAGDSALVNGLYAFDIGDLIRITALDAIGIYDDVDLIVLGYTEVIGPVEKTFVFNCMPAAPYQVAVWGSGVGTGPDRYDTDGSELSDPISTTNLFMTVVATGTTVWTTNDAEFPFDINVGGERMTVVDIIGAASPQTFKVTRSVNGVVKSHAAGTDVRLWKTPRYAL